MADQTVDARGLSCPEPVLLAKKAIEGLTSGTIEVLVDTVTSKENVTRMASTLSCAVKSETVGDGSFVLRMKKE